LRQARREKHTADSQTIKVLYCILDNRFGGPHRRAHSVSSRLREYNVETLFLTGRKTDDLWQPDNATVFQLRHLQCFQRHRSLLHLICFLCWLPHNVLRICRLIRSHKIDIVHVDGVTNLVPALAARLAGRPIVWHYNDHLPRAVQRVLLPLVIALASTVIVQGEGLRQSRTAGRRRLRDKTVVLYSGVDTARFDPRERDPLERRRIRQELGVPADCALIGAIGNLNRLKGHMYFLEAAAGIKRKVSSAKFLIVGRRLDTDPECWRSLQQLTEQLGLTQDVVYAGYREDIPAVLSALDVFVLPSILESCPLVVLEAMAMKVPVVATDVGAVSEMILDGRTGFVVPPRDGEAIARAVLICLTMPKEQVQDMTAAARKTVENTFGAGIMARRQYQVYERVLAHPYGRRAGGTTCRESPGGKDL
jgi:glycosyltransferase involved in cell wall biosynthesis